jgi:hypothetical protein
MFAAITATIAALLLHGGAAVDPVFSTATYVLQSSGNWTVPGPGMVKIRAWVRRTPRPVRCAASEPLPLLLQAGGGCGGSSASMGACHGGAGGNGGSNATVLTAKGCQRGCRRRRHVGRSVDVDIRDDRRRRPALVDRWRHVGHVGRLRSNCGHVHTRNARGEWTR